MGDNYLKVSDPATYKVDPAVTPTIPINSFVKWNTTTLVLALQAAGAAPECVGVTEGEIPISSNLGNGQNLENTVKVRESGVFEFPTTASDTYKHGLAVGVGADAQTIKIDATGANKVGIVWQPDGQSIAGGAGVTVKIKIMPIYVSK